MKKRKLISSIAAMLIVCLLSRCNSTDKKIIADDPATIAKGETSFNKNCSGCHNFKQDGIGPQLTGITSTASADWIQHFIANSEQLISAGDERAVQLIKKYKAAMPSFAALKEDEVNAIIAFLNTHKSSDKKKPKLKGDELANPIPDSIALSNLVVNLEQVTQIPASSDTGALPLARINKLSPRYGTEDLYVVDLRGKLYKLHEGVPFVYMDLGKLEPKFINEPGLATGFGSFAFHPDFEKNGLLYTTHSEGPRSAKADFTYHDSIKTTLQWVLTEWKTVNPQSATFSGTSRELLRVDMVSNIHGVQEITFNPLSKPGDKDHGLLYIGVGDGGCVENGYAFLAHSNEKIWGTILRIDPSKRNSSNGQYGIPSDNPFVKNKNTNAAGEIYAYGFRNPHRITWTKTGNMLACNIGQSNIESINLIKPGHDYGWPIREGNFTCSELAENLGYVSPLPANDSVYKITYPVAEYDHDEGKAISGGFEYEGKSIPQLTGKYLFGDIPSGRLFYIDTRDIRQGKQATIKEWKILINGKQGPLSQFCGSKRVDLHFGADANGELYILTKADGRIYKMKSAAINTSFR